MDAHARAELAGAAAMFLGMWTAMMVPMMLPSLVPMLRHYRQAVVTTPEPRRWADHTRGGELLLRLDGCRIAIYPLGVALTTIEMREPALARAVPVAVGVVVIVCGALQFSAWKLRHLSCCREAPHPIARSPLVPLPPGNTACISEFIARSAVPVWS